MATHTTTVVEYTLHVDCTHSKFTPSIDATNSGVLIVDPPATGGVPAPVVMHDPGPAPPTIVASAANQTLTRAAASDTFSFHFAGVGHIR